MQTSAKTIALTGVTWVYMGKMNSNLAKALLEAEQKYTLKELAVEMGCSVPTVRRRLNEARELLPKATKVAKKVRTPKRLPIEDAVKRVFDTVVMTGGNITQRELGALWGKSASWANKILNS